MNSLPGNVTSAISVSVFRRKMKTHLFQKSYPESQTLRRSSGSVFFYLGHFKNCNEM